MADLLSASLDSWNAPFWNNPASFSVTWLFRVCAETTELPEKRIFRTMTAVPSSTLNVRMMREASCGLGAVSNSTFASGYPFSRYSFCIATVSDFALSALKIAPFLEDAASRSSEVRNALLPMIRIELIEGFSVTMNLTITLSFESPAGRATGSMLSNQSSA